MKLEPMPPVTPKPIDEQVEVLPGNGCVVLLLLQSAQRLRLSYSEARELADQIRRLVDSLEGTAGK